MICGKCKGEMKCVKSSMFIFNVGSKPYGVFECAQGHRTGYIPLNDKGEPLDVKIRTTDPEIIRQVYE
jgi:hypothetical protein